MHPNDLEHIANANYLKTKEGMLFYGGCQCSQERNGTHAGCFVVGKDIKLVQPISKQYF